MNWVEAYLKRPHGVTALLLLGVVFGLISFRTLPLNLFPDANYPQAAVLLIWPGASAEDMTDRISRPVEKELAAIDQTRRVQASIRDETAAVKVEFEYEKGLDAAVTDVSAALDRIMPELPEGMLPPRIFRVSEATSPVMTLAVSPKPGTSLSMPKVRQLGDNEIQEALLRIENVADAEVFGGFQPEIRVSVDRDRMARYGLSVEQVLGAIGQQHRNMPSGTLLRDYDRVLIKIQGEKEYRGQLGNIVIGSGENGAIHLRDIAEIKTAYEAPKSFFRGNGRSAIGINILRAENGHVTPALESVEKALPEIRQQFGELAFEVADTQGELIRTSVSNLMTSLRDAVILTVCVIFLFLARTRITLLAALSIPVTFFLTFAGMKLLNYELNIVTMTAIILAVGLLVDDAIVVIENIDRHGASGEKSRFRATLDGTKEIFLADFAGTVTTLSVLLPIMFVGGYPEKILRPLTVVLSLALLSSFIASVTVIPLLGRRLLKPGGQKNTLESGIPP
ncbi:MAG: efflux RND transporter permease subunit, partial [Desulfobacterales bacterium]|nr:efflux RND transporter permease subunit [Desulfobacterales bacterium]